VAFAEQYRATVDAAYREYWAAVSETADRKMDGAIFLHADADPLRALGSASETHPAQLEAAMERLNVAAAGQPGRLILDPEASYGAVLHEMSHFSDDEGAGFPGLRYWLEDPAVTAAGESRAYEAEIDYARSIGEAEIADQLEKLRAQRISQLRGENDE
jgi:hypothetical protein